MYLCPVCKTPLEKQASTWVCENRHSFDIAKKGYVNLLLSHKMKSKSPGDSKMMIQARQAFLSAGYYQPLANAVVKLAREYGLQRMLDAGCGEGYYTAELARSGVQMAGLDISKDGIQAACKRDKSIDWCIGSVNDLPYLSGYFDGVLSVFCRVDDAEFQRVVRPGGVVVFVGPGDNHLPNLRAGLYETVRPYEKSKQADYLPSFEPLADVSINFPVRLDSSEQVHNLLCMTPHYWSTNPAQQQRLLSQGGLCDSADIQIRLYRRLAN
ncbi:putative RNA methyltransferase [Gilvimarinus sp. DA14]|uniref:putative RNA methyltransferase n=1 Tax=Gilvimarinus sp. DA14 TaxID=2956798 RepID=UPI0020B7E304|nr:methyltransferase domain-containing protein [Gilvimarinus sp. DA14]UTF60178.1 methyltransferase domain-containing protein [Gilvimarinus sp. DA14]